MQVAFTLFKWGAHTYHSKAFVGCQGVVSILVSFAMSFGICAGFGENPKP